MSTFPDPSASRVVLVGTSTYADPSLDDLPAVAANLTDLAELLRSPEVWGLPEQHCVIVSNPTTAAEVIDPIVAAAEEATDTLLVYYAGHGLIARRVSELHLALTGSKPNVAYTAVPYELIREELGSIRALRQVVILDCCYSGRALGGRMSAGDAGTAIADEAIIEGTYLIAAAAENRAALSIPGERHTAFTAELLTVLREGVHGKGPYLDLDVLYRQVDAALRAKQRPQPQRRVRNTADQLTFRNRAVSRGQDRWRALITEAHRVARTIGDEPSGTVIDGLARYDLAEAERLTRAIIDPEDREWQLRSVAWRHARHDPAAAQRLAHTIADPDVRADAFILIADELTDPDLVRNALAAAEQAVRVIPDESIRHEKSVRIAAGLTEHDPDRALTLLADLEHAARASAPPGALAIRLCAIARAQLPIAPDRARVLLAEAERIAVDLTDPEARCEVLLELVEVFAGFDLAAVEHVARLVNGITGLEFPTGKLTVSAMMLADHHAAAGERVAHVITDPFEQSMALREIVARVIERDPAEAERIARGIPDFSFRTEALRDITRLPTVHEDRMRDQLAREEHLVRTYTVPYQRARGLAAVAALWLDLDPATGRRLLAEAEDVADTITEPPKPKVGFLLSPPGGSRALVLREISTLWFGHDTLRARRLWAEFAPDVGLDHALGDLVKAIAGRDPVEAERLARTIPDPRQQTQALRDLSEALADRYPAEAERIARTIGDSAQQSGALGTIATKLTRQDSLNAERIARTIPEPGYRISALVDIADSLTRE